MARRKIGKKIVLGLIEPVIFYGKDGKKLKLMARIDTGATSSSLDTQVAKELKLGPVVRYADVKQASGRSKRPVMKSSLKIDGKELRAEFSIADRKHMRYKALIGQNILKRGFLIDPNFKTH